ncbi:MAG: hypothetical protein WCF65_03695 [Parachlamydiaceae bacterium]
MTKRILLLVLAGVCGAFLIGATLTAENAEEKKRTLIGTRAESAEQKSERLEARAALLNDDSKAVLGNKVSKSVIQTGLASKSLFYSSYPYIQHPAAYQTVFISYLGKSVELTDGSIWTVSLLDAYKMGNWSHSDLVSISPNHSFFSLYDYRLTNQNTLESVAVNLYLGPIDPSFGGIYTHWITAIDYHRNIVYLEDGTIWYMSAFDRNVVDRWVVNDVVIIGINDAFLSSSNPNILINVNMLNFAAGGATY